MVDMPKRVNKNGQEEGLRAPGKKSFHTGQGEKAVLERAWVEKRGEELPILIVNKLFDEFTMK